MNLVKPLGERNAEGRRIKVDPATAGWSYVGFEVYALETGEIFAQEWEDQEVCLVLMSGKANAEAGTVVVNDIGERMETFEKRPPHAIYSPPKTKVKIEALTPVRFAVCLAPAKGLYPPRHITPDDIGVEPRGHGSMQRLVHNILPENEVAESLLVVEVFTDGGNWSSYPPHKHDQDNLPAESYLEETYYHEVNPESGFVWQRVYNDDRSLDETMAVEHESVVLVPEGYHPVSAPPGYDSYYLNVMAGPVRKWAFHNDPSHEWLFKGVMQEAKKGGTGK
ncbi:5-deoxy-glucuronate isomerase [Aureibacillus halotolerans]|uniref:5-deoxy-glucuronate isomerase n=1 Tax=Aureibacillus halotolerans TaxID=1508390 RepID=A0A4R6U3H5_9BACI|nr:5-deoxy-glucuronate isomerase [Aureibacillus halotolerans]TDQ41028.1 5-deoxyglucuronate isomerase [Aureibacillus halotolerans]